MKNFSFILFFLLSSAFSALAQDKIPVTEQDYQNRGIEMADGFYQSGKIYVLVLIILSVVVGLLAYAVWIDRRLSKLEKEKGNK